MKHCVVVANGCRARIFTLDPAEQPEFESGPRLTERNEIVDDDLHGPDQKLWTGKAGANRGGSARSHGYDDHRQQHLQELEKRFLTSVSEETATVARRVHATDVVVVGSQRHVGELSELLSTQLGSAVKITAMAKDLAKLTPRAIHDHLAREGVLPAQRPATTH